MRRADRLFQIITILRRRRFVTAQYLADRLAVSPRTIYRDIRDLGQSGVPILGEAGVGYRLRPGFELPPIMFNLAELHALVLGARMVSQFADSELGVSAKSVLDKVDAVLPAELRGVLDDSPLFAIQFTPTSGVEKLSFFRDAAEKGVRLALSYIDREGKASSRVVHPLGLYFWGNRWTLAAYCELRGAHRGFRLDRIEDARRAGTFSKEGESTLAAFRAVVNSERKEKG